MAQYKLEGTALWERYVDPNFPPNEQEVISQLIDAPDDEHATNQAQLFLQHIKLKENPRKKLINIDATLTRVVTVCKMGFQSAEPAQAAVPEKFWATPAS